MTPVGGGRPTCRGTLAMDHHHIRGRVVDSRSSRGRPRLRVEVWDADYPLEPRFAEQLPPNGLSLPAELPDEVPDGLALPPWLIDRLPYEFPPELDPRANPDASEELLRRLRDDLVGVSVTDEEGRFSLPVDPDAFTDLPWERGPDLFFRVFHRDTLALDTKARTRWDASTEGVVVELSVDGSKLPPAPPTDLHADPDDGLVELTWTTEPGVTAYNLYWATEPGVTVETGRKIAGVSQPFTHTDRQNGRSYVYVVTAVDSRGESLESTSVTATPVPRIDPTVAGNVAAEMAFLYTGDDPPQRGIDPDTIDVERAAVIRGRVTSQAGDVLAGVTVSIPAHPEFGSATTRADGAFDMIVNGGRGYTIRYELEGFLPIERESRVPWQEYVQLPDIVVRSLSTRTTTVDLATPDVQIVSGEPSVDDDGERAPILIVPPQTAAMANGLATDTLEIGITEYTVGPSGPQAMPALLPPASGYTYAVEFAAGNGTAPTQTTAVQERDVPLRPFMRMRADESVQFDRPVVNYVENFLDFPPGTTVPTGFYDKTRRAWIPSDNGRVVGILAVTGGLADLDVDGSGTPADEEALATLGVTTDERRQLAAQYAPGQTLWRVLIPHFSPWDHNWPFGPPEDATAPDAQINPAGQYVAGSCKL